MQLAIVGSGFSGLGLAVRLKQQGFDDFVVLERADALGGVWLDHLHPGSACDVASHLYPFSFAPSLHWTRAYAARHEILAYLERCAHRHDLLPHLRFGHDVLEARWDDALQVWRVTTSAACFTTRVLVDASGFSSEPVVPDLPGLTGFAGARFHASHWDHAVTFDDRRVGVIGTGAAAAQIVPELQPRAKRLTVFQRTPAWVVPRLEHTLRSARLLAARPVMHRLARAAADVMSGPRVGNVALRTILERRALRHLEACVPDPALRTLLTPRAGEHRVLFSDTYLPALARANVEVVSTPIAEVAANGVVTSEGVLHELDALVLATGHRITEPALAARMYGRDGRSLSAHWAGRAVTHLGSMVSGFPNLFLLRGATPARGHVPLARMIERRIDFMLAALGYLWNQGATTLEPKSDVRQGSVEEPSPRRLRFRPEEYQLERGAWMEVRQVSAPPAQREPIGGSSERPADTQENA
ncbi:MAG: NAD(P)/FAD-dependent oxidoreductase [Polyangiales bacterium]